MNTRNKLSPVARLAPEQGRMSSLPAWVLQRIAALETELQPDIMGKYRPAVVLPQKMMLNASERVVVEAHYADWAGWLDLGRPTMLDGRALGNNLAILVTVAKLLKNSRRSKFHEPSASELTEDYLEALDDLPAWSVRSALCKRKRGGSSKPNGIARDSQWLPAPAALRLMAQMELTPLKVDLAQLEKLLIAVPRLEFSDQHRAEMLTERVVGAGRS
jgi:hypothetical protein